MSSVSSISCRSVVVVSISAAKYLYAVGCGVHASFSVFPPYATWMLFIFPLFLFSYTLGHCHVSPFCKTSTYLDTCGLLMSRIRVWSHKPASGKEGSAPYFCRYLIAVCRCYCTYVGTNSTILSTKYLTSMPKCHVETCSVERVVT
jgi:hypothetical protein